MRSTRLPGKNMRRILGRPMLEMMIERVRRAETLDEVVVATTDRADDDVIETLAAGLGVTCFRGSEDDVLDRVLRAARWRGADVIAELTGDCPLLDPAITDRIVRSYLTAPVDFVSNRIVPTYPDGLSTRVFSTDLLERVSKETSDPRDREHVSNYIWEHPHLFSLRNVVSGLPRRWWDVRLTVDTEQDFDLVTEIFETLYPRTPAFTLADVIALLERRPDLAARTGAA